MAYPLDTGQYILDTDACDLGIGAVLSQVQDGKERVIAYASRSLSKSEKNYCVTDKELLAVLYFTEYFRHYLLGRQYIVRSDHQALKWLFTLKDPKGRVARWIEILSAYNFIIEYRPGKQHANADSLSRCYNPRNCTCPEDETLKCGPCSKCKKRANDINTDETKHQTVKVNRVQRKISNMTTKLQYVWNYIIFSIIRLIIFTVTKIGKTIFNRNIVKHIDERDPDEMFCF